jgi:regulator of nonsense transcripts 2
MDSSEVSLRRAQLRKENELAVPLGEILIEFQIITSSDAAAMKTLDGAIKKNTSFIKKLKTFSAENVEQIKRELVGLKLEKYLSEVATAIVAEGRARNSADIWAYVQVSSLLCQRFKEFPEILVEGFRGMIEPPPTYQGTNVSAEQKEKEESARITRQKFAFRFMTELFLVGIIKKDNQKHRDLLPPHFVHTMVCFSLVHID